MLMIHAKPSSFCVLCLVSCVLCLASCVLRLASCVLRLASCVLRSCVSATGDRNGFPTTNPPPTDSTGLGFHQTLIPTGLIKAQHGRHPKSNWTTDALWLANTPEKMGTGVPPVMIITQPQPKKLLAKRSGKLGLQRVKIAVKSPNSSKTGVLRSLLHFRISVSSVST
jgi:hypothetical protein